MIQNIAVILTCFNRKDKTLRCLRALSEVELPENFSLDVFLVDDGSTDGTSDAIKIEFPYVNIIQGTGSLYWNRGMHLAWKTATNSNQYDFYFWLNDDVKLLKNSISILLDDYLRKPQSIICGVMSSEIKDEITYGGRDSQGNLIIPENNELKECYFINGNFVLVSKEVYSKVGLLDPIFPHAIGDFDYGLRASKLGFKSYISSQVVGYCESNPELPIWCRPKVKLRKRMRSLYSPLGNAHPVYYFKYELRHLGLIIAVKHYITIHLRLIAPGLWK